MARGRRPPPPESLADKKGGGVSQPSREMRNGPDRGRSHVSPPRSPAPQFVHTAYPFRRSSNASPFSTSSASARLSGPMCWQRLGRR